MSKHAYCDCRDCKRARRKGLILGSRLLKHLGAGAYWISDYVFHRKFAKGRKRKDCLNRDSD